MMFTVIAQAFRASVWYLAFGALTASCFWAYLSQAEEKRHEGLSDKARQEIAVTRETLRQDIAGSYYLLEPKAGTCLLVIPHRVGDQYTGEPRVLAVTCNPEVRRIVVNQ